MSAVTVDSHDLHDLLLHTENCLLIDWFSLSYKLRQCTCYYDARLRKYVSLDDTYYDDVPLSTLENALDFADQFLGLSSLRGSWLHLSGFHGFSKRIYFNGISIHYGGSESMGLSDRLWLEMSGQGCRAYEEYSECFDWLRLFRLPIVQPDCFKCSRLDIAYDDYTGILDIDLLQSYLDDHYCVTTFKDCSVEYSCFHEDKCIYYGSKKSDVMFRCYNKAAERGKSDTIDHWIRFEVQLRDDRALAFLQSYIDCMSLGSCYSGLIDKCFRYVEPTGEDTNKRRWNSPSWWTDFLGETAVIPNFTRKDTDYNSMKLENYVIGTAGAAIDTYISINGLEKFMCEVKKKARKKLNVKYESLKQSCKLQDDIWSSSKDLSEVFARLNSAGLIK